MEHRSPNSRGIQTPGGGIWEVHLLVIPSSVPVPGKGLGQAAEEFSSRSFKDVGGGGCERVCDSEAWASSRMAPLDLQILTPGLQESSCRLGFQVGASGVFMNSRESASLFGQAVGAFVALYVRVARAPINRDQEVQVAVQT